MTPLLTSPATFNAVVGFSKPDPRIYHHAIGLAPDNIRPEESLMIGDELDA